MKNITNRVLNFALFLSFCLMTGTGLLLAFRLPPGKSGGRGLSFLGYGRHDWGELHLWISYAFVFFVAAHLFVHRQWLMKVASGKKLWTIWGGLLFGALLILFFVFYPVHSRFQ